MRVCMRGLAVLRDAEVMVFPCVKCSMMTQTNMPQSRAICARQEHVLARQCGYGLMDEREDVMACNMQYAAMCIVKACSTCSGLVCTPQTC